MNLVHLSDVHLWRWPRPWEIAGKRAAALASLALGRARRFPRARLGAVVERIRALEPDHILISGDLTTSALRAEFVDAKRALEPLLRCGGGVSIVPGNHDRYTGPSHRARLFEEFFGAHAPTTGFPWLRGLDDQTQVLALDPTRAHLTATGRFPEAQIARAKELAATSSAARLIVLCHYPLRAPAEYAPDLARKRAVNADAVAAWLRKVGPHLYCCGHVHAAWSFVPADIPNQLCINAGAPLLATAEARTPPGFQQIVLSGDDVTVTHHGWAGKEWQTDTRAWAGFFARASRRVPAG